MMTALNGKSASFESVTFYNKSTNNVILKLEESDSISYIPKIGDTIITRKKDVNMDWSVVSVIWDYTVDEKVLVHVMVKRVL